MGYFDIVRSDTSIANATTLQFLCRVELAGVGHFFYYGKLASPTRNILYATHKSKPDNLN